MNEPDAVCIFIYICNYLAKVFLYKILVSNKNVKAEWPLLALDLCVPNLRPKETIYFSREVSTNQGDQIWRTFPYILGECLFLADLFENYRIRPNYCVTFHGIFLKF
jgi:hypothetical protein